MIETVSNPSSPPPLSPPFQDRAAFLASDLPHLFDDVGIDTSAYAAKVEFTDPITRYASLQGYLFNIAALRAVFKPTFVLRGVRQTGPRELTTRWTMGMEVGAVPGPLRPRLAFTGTSIMRVDDDGKFCSHEDTWDALTDQVRRKGGGGGGEGKHNQTLTLQPFPFPPSF
jgi:hypothetical protein